MMIIINRTTWSHLTEVHDDEWKEISLALMRRFCSSTNGTFVETKESAILWQFKDADPVGMNGMNIMKERF